MRLSLRGRADVAYVVCRDAAQPAACATFYTWLYRAALAAGGNAPEALIATNDVYQQLFGGKPDISADRGCNLTTFDGGRFAPHGARCRTCRTHYVVSSNDAGSRCIKASIARPATGNLAGVGCGRCRPPWEVVTRTIALSSRLRRVRVWTTGAATTYEQTPFRSITYC